MSIAIDLKYALRLLVKKPSFTAMTVLIVSVGLGLALYTYSLLNALLFSPVTFADNKPLYVIEGVYDNTHLTRRPAASIDIYAVAQNSELIDDFGIYQDGNTFVGEVGGQLRKYNSAYVSYNIFDFSGVAPLLGRGFVADDQSEGAEDVVVLGFDMWQQQFNGDAGIIGKTVAIDGAEQATVIGVMPQGFKFPAIAQMWQLLPESHINPSERRYDFSTAFVKLADGVSIRQVRSLLNSKNRALADQFQEDWNWVISPQGEYLTIEPYKKAHLTQYYGLFIALFIVALLILLLACINVGNLLLARVNERSKEVAIRQALGVSRNRLILQMLWESVFICSIGGIIALLLAGYGLEMTSLALDSIFSLDNAKPYWWSPSLDINAVFVLVATVSLMIVVTGLIPAWSSLNNDFNSTLRDGTRGALGKKAAGIGKALVVSEILFSCVVLVMASVILISTYSASNADYGVETDNRLTARLQLPPADYPIREEEEFEYTDRMKRSAFYYDLKEALESYDNIVSTIYMTQLPGTGGGTSYFEIEGRGAQRYDENPFSNNEGVSHNSWSALGMEVIQGRDFDYRDSAEGMMSIIINESIAKDFFPDGDAVGKRVRRARADSRGDWYTIVGVVSDTFHGSKMDFSSANYNTYHSMDNAGFFSAQIAIHYNGSEQVARASLQEALETVDPKVGVYQIQSYDDLIAQPLLVISTVSTIFLICGIVAALLAATGIYAVASNGVAQRTQEIGVRRAIGAPDVSILKMFLKQAGWQLTMGVLLGLGVSVWLMNLMSSTMLFSDVALWVALICMPLMIILMVLLATYSPAKRILNREPADALHHF
ncbi:ABC transporter permease [Ningiella sp. W23]|uniref:ABC transporter permease n=1 Tax=Ningiella sp. W23 TaxID=3023715 RepID=UPI0037584DEE